MATHTVSPGQSISSVVGGARSGDTVIVKDGTYKGKVNMGGSGITLKAEHRHKAIIDGAGMQQGQDLFVVSGSGHTIDGFEVRGATNGGIVLWDASKCTVINNKCHDCFKNGIYVGGAVGRCNENVIEANEVFRCVLENEARNWSGGWARGIGVDNSDRSVVRGNTVYNNYGEGIGVLSCIGVELRDNISYDNFSVLLYLDNAQEAHAQENIVYHTGNQEFFRNGRPALGISICNENTSRMLPSRGLNVTNNTMGDVGKPEYSEYGANTGLHDSQIEPNKICSAEEAQEEAEGGGGTEPEPPDPIEPPEPTEDLVVTVNIDVPEGVEVRVNVND